MNNFQYDTDSRSELAALRLKAHNLEIERGAPLSCSTSEGQFQKMAPAHFEALDPSETELYAWKLASIYQRRA